MRLIGFDEGEVNLGGVFLSLNLEPLLVDIG